MHCNTLSLRITLKLRKHGNKLYNNCTGISLSKKFFQILPELKDVEKSIIYSNSTKGPYVKNCKFHPWPSGIILDRQTGVILDKQTGVI